MRHRHRRNGKHAHHRPTHPNERDQPGRSRNRMARRKRTAPRPPLRQRQDPRVHHRTLERTQSHALPNPLPTRHPRSRQHREHTPVPLHARQRRTRIHRPQRHRPKTHERTNSAPRRRGRRMGRAGTSAGPRLATAAATRPVGRSDPPHPKNRRTTDGKTTRRPRPRTRDDHTSRDDAAESSASSVGSAPSGAEAAAGRGSNDAIGEGST